MENPGKGEYLEVLSKTFTVLGKYLTRLISQCWENSIGLVFYATNSYGMD